MYFDIITIFPRLFDSFLNESLIRKSIEKKLNTICIHDLRQWTTDKHKKVDDRPYGGGAGMLMMAEPIIKALDYIKSKKKVKKNRVVLLSPTGRQLDESLAKKLAMQERIIFICGRYEGIDARIDKLVDEKISIGPYILNGGELGAMVTIETISRFIPGFLGNYESLAEETKFLDDQPFKEYPQYTKPEILKINNKKYRVPKILLSGDHKKIKEWRNRKVT